MNVDGNMSARGKLPPLLAIIGGIAGGKFKSRLSSSAYAAGYYIFQPALEELDRKKQQEKDAYLGPNLVEVPIESMSKQREAEHGRDTKTAARSE